jgi:hypothetical protein
MYLGENKGFIQVLSILKGSIEHSKMTVRSYATVRVKFPGKTSKSIHPIQTRIYKLVATTTRYSNPIPCDFCIESVHFRGTSPRHLAPRPKNQSIPSSPMSCSGRLLLHPPVLVTRVASTCTETMLSSGSLPETEDPELG